MPTRKEIAEYKKKAKILKRYKLIDHDLRSKPTPAQRAVVTRLWKGRIAKDPNRRSHFAGWGSILTDSDTIVRTVSDKRARQLKQLGYRVSGRRVFLDSEGADKLHIKGNKIIRTYPDKEIEDILIGAKEIIPELERLTTDRPLKSNEFVTVRIGDHSPFRERFDNINRLLNYVSKWQPRKDFHLRDDLINQMSIVRFTDDKMKAILERKKNGKRKTKTGNTRR